jgi:DNA polymerase-1
MSCDLLTLLEQDGFRVVRTSTSRGGQYNGPCPFEGCGGRDRFRVQPNHGAYGWFACNQCGRKGSAIDYLILKRGLPKRDALAMVGWKPKEERGPQWVCPDSAQRERPQWNEPPQEWQRGATRFYRLCQRLLWSERGKGALAYLRQRGFTDTTIREALLGYHPCETSGPAKEWGRVLKLPQGIVIPWVIGGKVWRISIRDERVAEGGRRYKQIAGGSNGLYLADSLMAKQTTVVITEGEFDALSLAQECGDLAAAVATGTTQGSHTPYWVSLLARQERVLIAFDAERDKGDVAVKWWMAHLENAQRLRPWWKDANQMLQDGVDLRQWIESGLIFTSMGTEEIREDPMLVNLASTCYLCGASIEDMAHEFRYDAQGRLFCDVHWHESEPERESQPGITCIASSTFFEHVTLLAAQLDQLEGEPLQFSLDLETTGLDVQAERVVSIAFGSPGNVTILDMRPYYALPEAQQVEWQRTLRKLLEHPSVTWIGHNLKFDASMLLYHFGVRLHRVYDTMLAEQLLQAGRLSHKGAFSLLETASRYDIEVRKEEREWFPGLDRRPAEWHAPFPEQILAYITQDIEVPYAVYARQQEQIERESLTSVVNLENAALPALAAMEVRGALIDQERWKAVLRLKRGRQAAIEQELIETLGAARFVSQQATYSDRCKEYAAYQQALSLEEKRLMHAYTMEGQGKSTWRAFHDAGIAEWRGQHPAPPKPEAPTRTINLASTDHLIEALAQLGIQVTSTREEVLEEYASRYPVIARLLEWRKLQHFCSAFGENLLSFVKPDGRIHAHFNQIGAVSGRIICNGPNLQQIPKKREKEREEEDIRRCFIAPPGYRLVKADLSNIELRILAEVSRDPVLLRLFAERKDSHDETARLMFRLAGDVDTRKHLYNGVAVREIAKTINYGLNYGMGAQGLANRTGVSVEEARDLMRTYFTTYAGVARWLKSTARLAAQQGYVASLSGRKRFFRFDGLNKAQRAALERSAKNHAIQGTNADILKRALALLYDALPQPVHVILAVHDEIVLECPEDLVEKASQILKAAMIQACRDYLKVVHVPEPEVLVDTYWKKG